MNRKSNRLLQPSEIPVRPRKRCNFRCPAKRQRRRHPIGIERTGCPKKSKRFQQDGEQTTVYGIPIVSVVCPAVC